MSVVSNAGLSLHSQGRCRTDAKEFKCLILIYKRNVDRLVFLQLGGKLDRNIAKDKPSRPRGGYNLVVKDLGAPSEVKRKALESPSSPKQDCYVAKPDGLRRDLNEDEMYLQYSKKIMPRRKM